MKPKKKKPLSDATKRKISETLSGRKFGGNHQIIVDPKSAEELRKAVGKGDNFKHQEIIDWWRSGGSMS